MNKEQYKKIKRDIYKLNLLTTILTLIFWCLVIITIAAFLGISNGAIYFVRATICLAITIGLRLFINKKESQVCKLYQKIRKKSGSRSDWQDEIDDDYYERPEKYYYNPEIEEDDLW